VRLRGSGARSLPGALASEWLMRLENCALDIAGVTMAPPFRNAPEDVWLRARDSGAIPGSLFDLYARAGYLSFGAAPLFMKDDENILFSYFGMLLRSVMNALVDADDEVRLFVEARAQVYDPGKRIRGEAWDPTAEDRARRHLRHLVLSLQAALDGFSDTSALFFTGLVPNLRLGRAQFSRLEAWLAHPLPVPGLILSPQEHILRQLYDALRPLVYPDGPDRDWLRVMRLFRNKAAHMGDAVFRYVGLHDDSGRFYTFLPRQWPYILERYMKPAADSGHPDPGRLPALLRETLMHQDIKSWVRGLRLTVQAVLDSGFSRLNVAFQTFHAFPANMAALAELNGSSEFHAFEYFPCSVDDREQPGKIGNRINREHG